MNGKPTIALILGDNSKAVKQSFLLENNHDNAWAERTACPTDSAPYAPISESQETVFETKGCKLQKYNRCTRRNMCLVVVVFSYSKAIWTACSAAGKYMTVID